ncbi:MAG: dihydrofolate reductase [Ignavibacteriales bacterium]|nr:dihydrofolate reductase [Ignavibacteriales bacterium]
MRKVIFAINSTINGFADHDAVIADDELHDFFTNLLRDSDVILFGRKTYKLMEEFWPNAKDDPQSDKSTKEFSEVIDSIKKIVFSNTLQNVNWNNAEISTKSISEEIQNLKKQNGKNISVGSLSLASQLVKQNLIDEFYFVVHPIILGKGKPLFEYFDIKQNLKLIETRIFNSGAVVLHYQK